MNTEFEKESRSDLIIQIKHLIDITGEETKIENNILKCFNHEELKEIRNNLKAKKDALNDSTNKFLDEIYDRHTKK